MAESSTIDFIPTGGVGPKDGRLRFDYDRLDVVTGAVRPRVHLTRSVLDLGSFGAAPATRLSQIAWLTPDAKRVLEAIATEDPSVVVLLMRFGGAIGDETWLFRGPANSLALVVRTLQTTIADVRAGLSRPPSGAAGLAGDLLGGIVGSWWP